MLQCHGVCCNVLQCVAVCCANRLVRQVTGPPLVGLYVGCVSVLQHFTACCCVLQRVAACRSLIKCVAVECSVLQRVVQLDSFVKSHGHTSSQPVCECV